MQIELSKPLPFIKKEGLTNIYINSIEGKHTLTDGKTFKQIIKQSEYDAIMKNAASISGVAKKQEEKEVLAEAPQKEAPAAVSSRRGQGIRKP